jgi:hypothetical protein
VTATLTFGGAASSGGLVRFSVTGLHARTGSAATNAQGQAQFCYTPGDSNEGDDSIVAFADRNSDASKQSNEPSDSALKCWDSDGKCGFPRPKGATPVYASLVPAYKPCVTPNRTHGPPLVYGSCKPPVQVSDYLTLGAPDSNGKVANSVGFLRLGAIVGNPSNSIEDSDLSIQMSLTDVRKKTDLSDYGAQLRAVLTAQITDKYSGASLLEHATGQGYSIAFTVPCDPTTDTSVGSTCALTTTFDSVFPGAIVEARRANWELGKVQVYDGGADGLSSTTVDNTLFETQGILVP